MLTFGELVVVDPRTLRPVVGVAQVTDAHTGDPLDTFDAAGVPAPVVSSARGYVGQFHTADDHPLVRLTFPEGDPVVVAAREAVTEAATVVNTIERGRLSPDVLSATIANTVEAKAGNVPIFGTQTEALTWEDQHPGQKALWFDAGYTEVTATGPTWVDSPLGGGTWSTPTEPGVIYTPASGTADPGQIVTVTATARPGYALLGDRSWTHTFPMSVDTLLTDFTEYPRDAIPADWTARWVIPTTNGWKVETFAAATGGAALVHRGADNARRALTWDAAEPLDTVDVELVFKWRTSNTNPARGIARASGAAATEHGYYAGVRNATNQSLGKFINGTGTLPLGPQAPTNIVADTWYITRFRVVGNQLSSKTWAAVDPEPMSWAVTTTDADITADGWVGLQAFGAGVMAFDWVGIGINGETAPKGP